MSTKESMEKTAMPSSVSPSDVDLVPSEAVDSHITSLFYDLSRQVQVATENMLKMIDEIHQNSLEVNEEIEKSKYLAFERKKNLEEEKENFQKAAYAVLDMLNNREIS